MTIHRQSESDAPANLSALAKAAAACRRCPLYRRATQTVFGEGPPRARIVLVGEQPGDREDRTGRPFVGPAGRLLDRALARAGLERRDVYVTNAVKHFKWTEAHGRRLHEKPNAREIAVCQYWLEQELDLIQPALVVALGATAAQAMLGRDFRVTRNRGRLVGPADAPWRFLATVHPSSILRMAPADQDEAMDLLVRDLARAAQAARRLPARRQKTALRPEKPEPEPPGRFPRRMPTPKSTAATGRLREKSRNPRQSLVGSKAKAAREKTKLRESRARLDDAATTEDTSVRSSLI